MRDEDEDASDDQCDKSDEVDESGEFLKLEKWKDNTKDESDHTNDGKDPTKGRGPNGINVAKQCIFTK